MATLKDIHGLCPEKSNQPSGGTDVKRKNGIQSEDHFLIWIPGCLVELGPRNDEV